MIGSASEIEEKHKDMSSSFRIAISRVPRLELRDHIARIPHLARGTDEQACRGAVLGDGSVKLVEIVESQLSNKPLRFVVMMHVL